MQGGKNYKTLMNRIEKNKYTHILYSWNFFLSHWITLLLCQRVRLCGSKWLFFLES